MITRQPVLNFAVPKPNATFGGVHPGGGCDPQNWTRPRFLYNTPTPKFHHPVFTRWEVIVLTNKQTLKMPLKTSNALRYFMTLGKNEVKIILLLMMEYRKCNMTRISAFTPQLYANFSLLTSSTLSK